MDQQIPDLIFKPVGRYLSLHGSYVDQLGEQPHALVTAAHKYNRKKRDHGGHHVTVINHLEIARLTPLPPPVEEGNSEQHLSSNAQKKLKMKERYNICSAIIKQFGLPSGWKRPVDLGLGITRQDNSVSFFRVLYWPFGQDIRREIGLASTNFHITVGFAPHDVHLYKGPATLVCLQKGQICTPQQINQLVGYTQYYFNDWEFIKKLGQTCWRHGYYKQLIRFTRLVSILYIYSKLFKKEQYPATATST